MRLTRRTILQSGAAALAAPAIGCACLLCRTTRVAQERTLAARPVAVRRPEISRRASSISTTSTSNAPKGGAARLIAFGTFDNFNLVVAGVKGSLAAGIDQIYDTLMAPALDEVSTEYGLLAEAVSHPDDYSSVTYRLRAEAKWHDGKPVTVEDVIFSLDAFKKHHPQYSAYYRHVVKAEKTGEREVTFTFDEPGNRELPQIVGQLNVLPKH